MARKLKQFDHKDWSLLIELASEGEVRFDTYAPKFTGDEVRNANIINIPAETAHALADWIIANVPKPEPTPLPTKRAAVVKSGVAVFTLGDSEEPKWLELDSNGDLWLPSDTLANRDFEVLFEGVDD